MNSLKESEHGVFVDGYEDLVDGKVLTEVVAVLQVRVVHRVRNGSPPTRRRPVVWLQSKMGIDLAQKVPTDISGSLHVSDMRCYACGATRASIGVAWLLAVVACNVRQ